MTEEQTTGEMPSQERIEAFVKSQDVCDFLSLCLADVKDHLDLAEKTEDDNYDLEEVKKTLNDLIEKANSSFDGYIVRQMRVAHGAVIINMASEDNLLRTDRSHLDLSKGPVYEYVVRVKANKPDEYSVDPSQVLSKRHSSIEISKRKAQIVTEGNDKFVQMQYDGTGLIVNFNGEGDASIRGIKRDGPIPYVSGEISNLADNPDNAMLINGVYSQIGHLNI